MDPVARGMSPFSDRASCCIHFTWGCLEILPELPPLLESLENVLRPFKPRPHYGKLVFNGFESDRLAAVLPTNFMNEWVVNMFEFDAFVSYDKNAGLFLWFTRMIEVQIICVHDQFLFTNSRCSGKKFQNDWLKCLLGSKSV
jgi:hypothetical protein